ncbi:NmrA family NAD(P)-binding protein [Granulicella mallensis]|uniref:Uncharacterized protein YbjT (DUF2867 family) n=1 Tax=Granulicella mallensis TaxID=940614 RepID=A0A7W8EDI7_9BACT|nr:NmrA family NAD(P)-binding protein [Granulicella mallensis]MBB5066725.1 uncharacterized protein YbjT (DUF2867 family) [Granulicella mallensis]
MFAITGITGQVGGAAARTLLADGHQVRAVVRQAEKGRPWTERGCELAIADLNDKASLTSAFRDMQGVFVLIPPDFDQDAGFASLKAMVATIRLALEEAKPARVVVLTAIGAQVTRPNLLTGMNNLERMLGDIASPISFVRAAWFMENVARDLGPARNAGMVPTLFQPLDKRFPMVSTEDVGITVAQLLSMLDPLPKFVELEGPGRISPDDIASVLGDLLGRKVNMQAVPRDVWEDVFLAQGMKNPLPLIQMFDGFNEGWLEFQTSGGDVRKGKTTLREALGALVRADRPGF